MTVEIFDTLRSGGRLQIGRRTIVAVGKPKCIGACATDSKGLGKLSWEAPLRSATIVIGQKKGKRAQNKAGRCAAQPASFSTTAVDRWFSTLRGEQVGRKNLAATRIKGKGWYKGDNEPSVSYQIIHDPSVPGEDSLDGFRQRMQRLAENLAEHFCQDEVLVVMDTEKGKHTYSYEYDVPPPPKRRLKRARALPCTEDRDREHATLACPRNPTPRGGSLEPRPRVPQAQHGAS